ncbi:hypothetical protein AEAC466_20975 [Asticcacaulis sp. AC466]|nr:hypothetical protein AEAC466_20975 [Asticcacaulis sp. AC466]
MVADKATQLKRASTTKPKSQSSLAEAKQTSSVDINDLLRKVQEQDATIARLKQNFDQQALTLNSYKSELRAANSKCSNISARYDTVAAQNYAILNSRTWKATAWLRKVVSAFIMAARKAKLLASHSKNHNEAIEKAEVLANSHMFDPHYVCKQLNITSNNRLEVARLFYTSDRTKNLHPSPLFDCEYYKTKNKLTRQDDAIEHFLTIGAKEHLPTHRLFDNEWYIRALPEAADAPDLITHYFEVGRKIGITPVDPSRVAISPLIERLFFYDLDTPEAKEFDALIYVGMNGDLAHLPEADLRHHFDHHAKYENRIGTAVDLFNFLDCYPHEIPIDFNPAEYAAIHLDLAELYQNRPLELMRHYLKHGVAEGRPYNLSDLFGDYKPTERVFSESSLQHMGERTPLCVIMHMYYTDMWDELSGYLKNITLPFDLYINLVDTTWNTTIISEIRAFKPDARIYISANKGRDIGGFWRLMDSTKFDQYLSFAILHAKKSPHVADTIVTTWKSDLLSAILGSEDIVRQNIAAMIEDPKIGIIGSAKWRNTDVASNSKTYEDAMDFYNISEENRDCEYVSGTMMIVRSEIMKAIYMPLKDYDFEDCDAKSLSFHMDGQMAHSIERLYGNIMKELGYEFLWR